MSITANDFLRLRWNLLFLGLAIVAGMVVTTASMRLIGKAEATQRQLSAEQQDIRAKLSRTREEEQEMRGKIALFQQLLDRGVIGQEERLTWVERIAQVKAARRLLDLQYELSPQKPVEENILPGGANAGGYEFMASTMKLQLPLLHEDDLLGFFADLRRTVHAHLLVRDCIIERTAIATVGHGLPAQMRARCTIDWITLREKKQ
jgi:hypothetical protein